MREYKPHLLILTGASHSHACHSNGPDFPQLRVYNPHATPLAIARLGLRFGRILMRFVEVAGVSRSLTSCFPLVRLSAVGLTLTHATTATLISRSCASITLTQLPWL